MDPLQSPMMLAGLFVFSMRLIDMSLDTFRLLLVMRGHKFFAGIVGMLQATVFILAVSTVLHGELNVWTVSGYALGFGFGVMLGMFVEERLAMGYAMLRVYSPSGGRMIAESMRQAGYAVTEIAGRGQMGQITIINAVVRRRKVQDVRAIIDSVDTNAFITVDEARPLQSGYFRH